MEISEEIKNKRTQLGLTPKDFADALGLGRDGDRIIKSWETGETTPSMFEFRSLMKFAEKVPFSVEHNKKSFKFIDLFAGIGGIRIPFQELGGECVFTSEWDKFAQKGLFHRLD